MGKIKVHVGLLGFLLGSALLLVLPSFSFAQTLQLQPILPPLPPVSSTINSLGLPVQLGTSQSGLPTVPAIDPNALLYQTTTDVNSLNLVQLPQVDLGLPTLPAINPDQLVGNTVTQVNDTLGGTVPLPGVTVPNPLDLLTPTGSGGGTSGPGPVGSNGGGTGGPSPTSPTGVTGPSLTMGPTALTASALAGIPLLGSPLLTGFAAGGPAGAGGRGAGMNLAPASPSGSDYHLGPLSSGLAMLPVLGILCVFLALAAYLRSARHVWQARL